MPHEKKTLIMKFGGAATRTPESFARLAQIIIHRSLQYPRIGIVVSAMGDMTDQLIQLAHQIHPSPPKREYDMLVSAGERISIALLAMALAKEKREAVSFTGSQSGIITSKEHGDARIVDVKPFRLLSPLNEGKFVIVAGFQGMSLDKEITTLGRGGSDTTAVALGVALRAERVEFYKDVQGIHAANPKEVSNSPIYSHLSYEQACEIVKCTGGRVLHPRAIELARKNGLVLQVRSFTDLESTGTLIGNENCPPSESQLYEESLSFNLHGVCA